MQRKLRDIKQEASKYTTSIIFSSNSAMAPHFVLFPFMAQGHMIPMVDIARLLAAHGVKITIITTPHNAGRFQSILARATKSGLPIQTIQVRFPSEEVGLPKGCENFDMVASPDAILRLFRAADRLEEPVKKLLEHLFPKPNCIISDFCLIYTSRIASEFNIPRMSFHGMGCFCLVCLYKVRATQVLDSVSSESEYFAIPDLSDHVEFTKSQLPFAKSPENLEWNELLDQIIDTDLSAYGVLMNTFEELEPAYVKEYKRIRRDKVWCVGPVSLCNKEDLDKAQRGNKSSFDEHQCLKWLDSWQPASVLYVCLGSLCNLTHEQMIELGLGLETSSRPFIWVIRAADKFNELGKWISGSGFEERTKNRCLLIRGWAPQVLVLSHPAIGGFLTHCGWNSTIEGITAGVPLLTWPLFGDQFCNEKLAVQILKIGVTLGVKVPTEIGEEEKAGIVLKKEDIKRVIQGFFDEGEETKKRRERAQKLQKLAKEATEEGGSSYNNLKFFIQDIMEQRCNVNLV